jgi:hypothetical protein
MTFQSRWVRPLMTCYLLSGAAPAAEDTQAADDALQEIVVTATLRSVGVAELPQSVTVLDANTLRTAGVQHFEDVLSLIPNLNWAAGTSLPAAIFPAARHRRGGTVPRRAESVGRLSDR